MEENTTIVSESQQADAATPADNGGKSERLFTQDELNKIIADRLSREREKYNGGTEALDQRAAALDEREKQLNAMAQDIGARESEINNAQMDAKKYDFLTTRLGARAETARSLVKTIQGDTIEQFKDNAKDFLSTVDLELTHDLDKYHPAGNDDKRAVADSVVRKAFGLRRK